MKKMIVTLIILLAASTALADPALTWDPNPADQHVDLYQVAISGTIVATLAPNTWVMVDISDGAHKAAVRAHNSKGWGPFSNELDFNWPYVTDVPTAPTGVQIIDVDISTLPPQ